MRKLTLFILAAVMLVGCGMQGDNGNSLPVCLYEPKWDDYENLTDGYDAVNGIISDEYTYDEQEYFESMDEQFRLLYKYSYGSLNEVEYKNITPPGFFRNTGFDLYYEGGDGDVGFTGRTFLMYNKKLYELFYADGVISADHENPSLYGRYSTYSFPYSMAAADANGDGQYELYCAISSSVSSPGQELYCFDIATDSFDRVDVKCPDEPEKNLDNGYDIMFHFSESNTLEVRLCDNGGNEKYIGILSGTENTRILEVSKSVSTENE